MISPLNIQDYRYDLPEHRIAKFPLEKRELSKLLRYKDHEISDHCFKNVIELLPANSTLVFNNTRVVQARMFFEKTAGAKPIEIFCLEPHKMDVAGAMATKGKVVFTCLVGNAKRWTNGLTLQRKITIGQENILLKANNLGREDDAFLIEFTWDGEFHFAEILEMVGKVPLPPYLNRNSQDQDKERYQTVYAKHNGSVAAPTAGLHFTPNLLVQIASKNIAVLETTLHVGAGTFKPVSTEDVREHTMHAEEIHITADFLKQLLAAQQPLFCVGTTSARTLESLYWLGVKVLENPALETVNLAQWDAYTLPQNIAAHKAISALLKYIEAKNASHIFTQTQLIIAPGYLFRMIDGLFTNFHQPGSTLILLVAAAIGDEWKDVYNHALQNNYRFLSYGDSSLLFIPPKNKVKLD